ncbi:MAG: DUF4349 domain-containing protein [Coriobacteriia bacterium]|nr:DUF4349 domain-containing protein [Coriobacteriia bacterium]
MRHAGSMTTARSVTAMTILLAAALGLAGCSGTPTAESGMSTGRSSAPAVAPSEQISTNAYGTKDASAIQPSPEVAPTAGSGDVAAPGQTKLVIVNKTLRIETDDVNAALDKIRSLARRDGGDIANMQVSTSNDQPIYRPMAEGTDPSGSTDSGPLRAYVTVRVPSKTYQAFVADAVKLGRVLSQSESADDVTQQHVDMQARLDNLRAEQVRLRQMFAKARNVSEMLEVERELARVQGEVESLKAQIDYLERQAAMATVTIELAEPKPLVRPAGIDWGVGTAVTDSIRAFVGTLNVLIVMLGPAIAVLLFVVLPVWLVVRAIVRTVKRRKARSDAAAEAEAADGIIAERVE